MSARVPIPFGGTGLVTGTGVYTTEPATLADVRNIALRPGRAARRPGLAPKATLAGETAILGVHPVRSLGVTAVVAFNASTRAVRLYLMGPDFSTRLVGTVWTLPAGVPFPRVSMADVWDRLILAHDEPIYAQRQVTRVFTPTPTETITDLTADLHVPSAGAAPVRFRGVARYYTYLVGWGYGSENVGDENRGEVVRFSLPDDPTSFVPEHYFIAGQRADPVLGCWPHGDTLAVRKATESYTIFGTDRPSFGIVQADALFGVGSSRLAVTVGQRNYFWSLDGPRVSEGGASTDLALPLDLSGYGLSTAPAVSLEAGFAAYDPGERAVVFCFGAIAYLWHVEQAQWTIREYAHRQHTAGVLLRDGGGGLGPTAFATFGSVTAPAPALGAAGAPLQATATIDGVLVGGEVLELWARPTSGSAWSRVGTAPITALGSATVISGLLAYGTSYAVAVRVTLNGIGQSGATAASADDWSPSTRGGPVITGLPALAARSQGALGPSYFTSIIAGTTVLQGQGAMVFFATMPPTDLPIAYDSRTRPVGGGAWTDWEPALPVDFGANGRAILVNADPVANLQREVEVRARTADVTGTGVPLAAGQFFQPRQPAAYGVAIGTPTVHTITASVEPVVLVRDEGEFQVQRNGLILGGADISPFPVPIAFEGGVQTAQTIGGGAHFVRVRIRLGAIDFFSPWRPAS